MLIHLKHTVPLTESLEPKAVTMPSELKAECLAVGRPDLKIPALLSTATELGLFNSLSFAFLSLSWGWG